MAWPAPLWASGAARADADGGAISAGATEGASVFVEAVNVGGKPAYLTVAAVPEKDEQVLVKELARRDAKNKNFYLAVSGPDDPALKAALDSGYLPWINTFHIVPAERAPLLNSDHVSPSLKSRILDKVKKISDFAREKKRGLFMALTYGSAVSGFTLYESSSIEAGLGVLIPLTLWMSFVVSFPMHWDKMLEKGGKLHAKIVRTVLHWFGRELGPVDKHLLMVAGKFNTSWAVSAASVAYVFWQAGTLDSLMQALWFGFINNYNIWDATMFRKIKDKTFSPSVAETYFTLQFFAGTVAEVAAYLHTPHMEFMLGSITATGLVYLGAGQALEKGLGLLRDKVKVTVQNGVANVSKMRRRLQAARGFFRKRVVSPCQTLLTHSSEET
jgi:hypothetical protein